MDWTDEQARITVLTCTQHFTHQTIDKFLSSLAIWVLVGHCLERVTRHRLSIQVTIASDAAYGGECNEDNCPQRLLVKFLFFAPTLQKEKYSISFWGRKCTEAVSSLKKIKSTNYNASPLRTYCSRWSNFKIHWFKHQIGCWSQLDNFTTVQAQLEINRYKIKRNYLAIYSFTSVRFLIQGVWNTKKWEILRKKKDRRSETNERWRKKESVDHYLLVIIQHSIHVFYPYGVHRTIKY